MKRDAAARYCALDLESMPAICIFRREGRELHKLRIKGLRDRPELGFWPITLFIYYKSKVYFVSHMN